MEEGETYEQAIRREIKEEIEVDLGKIKLLRIYNWPVKTEAVFHAQLDINIDDINLHEGQKIQFFTVDKLKKMKLGFHDNQIISDFSKLNNSNAIFPQG